MSYKMPTTGGSAKDGSRQTGDAKASASCLSPIVPVLKLTINKVTLKDSKEMSPGRGSEPEERAELLGSLTTHQQQRTSARVIKKLRLEPMTDKKKTDGEEPTESDTPNKIDDKEPKFPTVKQRMPKALWSTDEKNLFFEALNEYGKDFDAITSYICSKMKKKGMPDVNLKTKTQVSHFYYRTWHKLSKHVHFDENVKKVAQELYALINYGELRKKLVSVNEKTCGRLGEMVLGGSIMVRARGRNMRVRTPMCRALRRLNQITERACGSRVCAVAVVSLYARDAAAWARVQAAAHNPRACAAAPPRTRLKHFIHALSNRWRPNSGYKRKTPDDDERRRDDTNDHLNLETDRLILREKSRKLVLHVGPRASADIHVPVVQPLSTQKICFASYLERMCEQRLTHSKIRPTKRSHKDSSTDKELDQKKPRIEEEVRLINIEETAIDGIELMASYKHQQEDERPSTEDERDTREDEGRVVTEEEIDRENEVVKEKDSEKDELKTDREEIAREKDSEREKDSGSEIEDDEKFVKSDTDNESDCGKIKDRKFKNLKVKFRIRPKKRGGSVYTVVTSPDKGREIPACGDVAGDVAGDVTGDVTTALAQIARGWSESDAGDLTIGDLYLMFGSRSKLELDYWWAEPTPPLSPPPHKHADTIDKGKEKTDREDDQKTREDDLLSPKNNSHDSNDGLSGDEKKGEVVSGSVKPLPLTSKLVNRPQPPQPDGFSLLSDRLKRLLSLAGNPLITKRSADPCVPDTTPGRKVPRAGAVQQKDPLFRHPTPIAPRTDTERGGAALELGDVPRTRRGRPRVPHQRVVVQRLLPLLPKLTDHATLIPVKVSPASPAPPRILPKPPPTSTTDLSLFYVLSESNGQFFFHDGDRRIPITQAAAADSEGDDDLRSDEAGPSEGPLTVEVPPLEASPLAVEVPPLADSLLQGPPSDGPPDCNGPEKPETADTDKSEKTEHDMGSLPSECVSPSRLLREEAWLEGSVQDFSLSSFLGHLDGRPHADLAVDSQLQSLLAEASVDYVAKFADLAAEVTADPPPAPHTT